MRSFITGIDGFIGSYLTEALLKDGDTVYGLTQSEPPPRIIRGGFMIDSGGETPHPTWCWGKTRASRDITIYQADITDPHAVASAIQKAKPDRIFHLAAQSNIPRSLEHPAETFNVNINGSVNVFDAVRSCVPNATVISVGSSAEYGTPQDNKGSINESTTLAPTSPYAVSKASQGMIAKLYCVSYSMNIIHVRPFAVIGPGKVGDALSDFCRAVVHIEQEKTDPILHVGNLNSVRDFIDVRDCVRTLMLISDDGGGGEVYNICNGIPIRLQKLVDLLKKMSSITFDVVTDKSRLRSSDDLRLVGDNTKLVQLGYKRIYDLETTIRDTLGYWRVHEGTRHHTHA